MENEQLSLKIGKKIRLLREYKEFSQEDLAIKSKMGIPSISIIERGKANPTLHSLNQIANSLEVDISELFNFTI